jgi:hypothetical protein
MTGFVNVIPAQAGILVGMTGFVNVIPAQAGILVGMTLEQVVLRN